jgi:hypothetical protein
MKFSPRFPTGKLDRILHELMQQKTMLCYIINKNIMSSKSQQIIKYVYVTINLLVYIMGLK